MLVSGVARQGRKLAVGMPRKILTYVLTAIHGVSLAIGLDIGARRDGWRSSIPIGRSICAARSCQVPVFPRAWSSLHSALRISARPRETRDLMVPSGASSTVATS
jgi:hypothetical protein